MKHRIVALFVMLALAGTLVAHGGLEHVSGIVKAITADSMTVETVKQETVVVLLTPKTEFLRSKVKADGKDLKVGDRVVIHAMKTKDGKFEAHEVAFGPTSGGPK
jgi:Domain of unknown function (DUF5666)